MFTFVFNKQRPSSYDANTLEAHTLKIVYREKQTHTN
jgi:hypothetical protein